MVAISSRLLSLVLAGTAVVASPAKPITPTRDSTQVRTPKGLRDPANVHTVPKGGEVRISGDEVHLLDSSGNIIHTAPNSPSSDATDFVNGWTAYANWVNAPSSNPTDYSPISFLNSTWTVPEAPTTDDGQLVYLFNALIPADGENILQPVLQWGVGAAGGGPYWAVASWYLVGDEVYNTQLITVNVGDVLEGVMTLTGSNVNANEYNYTCEFTNIEGTTIIATNSIELVWASETLEAYDIEAITDYPASSTVFSNINIETLGGPNPSTSWTTDNFDTADGIVATVDVGGTTNAQVTISY